MKKKTLSPMIWFIVLWLGGLAACLLLAQSVRLLLPKVEKHKIERTALITKKESSKEIPRILKDSTLF